MNLHLFHRLTYKLYSFSFCCVAISVIISLFYPDALLITAGITAIIPLLLLISFSLKSGTLIQQLLSIGYIAGSTSCWVIGFLACYYLNFDIARYPWVTLALVNISNWSAYFGSIIAVRKKKSNTLEGYSIQSLSIQKNILRRALIISILFFCTYVTISYISGAFNARFTEQDYAQAGSLRYFLTAVQFFLPLVFLFLGASFRDPLISIRNMPKIVFLLSSLTFLSLGGGREILFTASVYVFSGILLFTKISRRQLFSLATVFFCLLLFWFNGIGYARSLPKFTQGNLAEKLEVIYTILSEGVQEQGNEYDNPLYGLFSRITEPTGQNVIDGVVSGSRHVGFVNLDRIVLLFVPKFLLPGGEKIYDDAAERLEKYGIYSKFGAASPITLMADAFERWGFLGIGVFSSLTSFYLTRLAEFVSKIKILNPNFGIILLTFYSFYSMRIYSTSVLGLVSLMTYSLFRDAILLAVFFLTVKGTSLFSQARFKANPTLR
jgi:hypothetical protein